QILAVMRDEAGTDPVEITDGGQMRKGSLARDGPFLILIVAGGQTDRHVWRCDVKGRDRMRIEAHDRDRTAIGQDKPRHFVLQIADLIGKTQALVLDLDKQRHPACNFGKQICQRRDGFRGAKKAQLRQIIHALGANGTLSPGQPRQVVVVKHQRRAIGRALDVAFDAISRSDSGAKGRHAVFRHARPMQSSMGNGHVQKIRVQTHHANSNTASISTATPRGRAGAETAARAWRPRSPNTSTIRFEQPLITSGWSVNSGVELTKPASLTTRVTRSSEPSAARACASSARPQARAASAPSSAARSAPRRPLAGLICPETNSRLPVITKGT